MPTMLENEVTTYEQNRERLLATAEGKYVLIRGKDVSGTFETEMDAITEGYNRFGNVPFLVKQVLQIEIPVSFTSNLLGA